MHSFAIALGMESASPQARPEAVQMWPKIWAHLGHGPRSSRWTDDPHGLTMGITIYDEYGESCTTYFEYDAELDDYWYPDVELCSVPSFVDGQPATAEDRIHRHLSDRLGVGEPCQCGICAQGGDCCGRWFAHSLELWPASTEFGEFRWYGKVSSSRNI